MILTKMPDEVALIREACGIVAKTIKIIEKEIRPGVTTEELDRIAEEIVLESGALPAFKGYRGFSHTTCISVNEEIVHGIPSTRAIKEGDIVSFDVGAVYKGYHGDAALTIPAGRIGRLQKKLIACAKEALEKGIAQARGGSHLGDVSAAIEGCAAKYGFSVVRDLFGHGVGRDLHEDPLIPNYGMAGAGPELKPGMVLAIEPMVNAGRSEIRTLDDGWTVVTADGSLSAHCEHTILITDGEAEILTK